MKHLLQRFVLFDFDPSATCTDESREREAGTTLSFDLGNSDIRHAAALSNSLADKPEEIFETSNVNSDSEAINMENEKQDSYFLPD